MNRRHLDARIRQCQVLSEISLCPRRKFAAMIIDPRRNVMLMDGFNGGPRGGSHLCGDGVCLRDQQQIPSGQRVEVGCHHAEMNAICNAAANGVATASMWMLVTGEPCAMCAKLIHHAGITRVIVIPGSYSTNEGVSYLERHGVAIERWTPTS